MDLPSTIALLIAIILPIITAFIYIGLKLCLKNNAFGVLILFIFLNIFGLIWGLAILYNYRHNVDINKKNENDEQNNISSQSQSN